MPAARRSQPPPFGSVVRIQSNECEWHGPSRPCDGGRTSDAGNGTLQTSRSWDQMNRGPCEVPRQRSCGTDGTTIRKRSMLFDFSSLSQRAPFFLCQDEHRKQIPADLQCPLEGCRKANGLPQTLWVGEEFVCGGWGSLKPLFPTATRPPKGAPVTEPNFQPRFIRGMGIARE